MTPAREAERIARTEPIKGDDNAGVGDKASDAYIQTHTGVLFHAFDPKPEDINISDVARALSMTCRWNGHVSEFFSVAEHSIIMSDWCRGRGYSRETCLTALLHDSAETYIGDMVRPFKMHMPEFRELERGIDEASAERFGTEYPFPPIVKKLDAAMLRWEAECDVPSQKPFWDITVLPKVEGLAKPYFWSPAEAEQAFLGRYVSLTKG